MAKIVECLITSSVVGKGAYAVTTDTDQTVYISFNIADMLNLKPFELVKVIVVKNDRDGPEWKAIRVERIQPTNLAA